MYNNDDKIELALKIYFCLVVAIMLARLFRIITCSWWIATLPISIPMVIGVFVLIVMLLRMKGK